MDTLRHNIGRLCIDSDGNMYIIVDVVTMPWSTMKYRIYNIKTGGEMHLYPQTFDNPNFVTWLTPPRQNPVAQPPERQNDDASE